MNSAASSDSSEPRVESPLSCYALHAPLFLGLKREQGSCSMAPLPEALLASNWSSMAASSVSWNRVPRITESSEWQSERSRDVDVEDCPSARENSDTCEMQSYE